MVAPALDTAEHVMACALEGRLSKHALASLLTLDARNKFYGACGVVERDYTDNCRALNDPCLDSGCSAEGERCLQPLLRAGTDYYRSCGAEWVKLFADRGNRDSSWKVTFNDYL